MPNPKGTPSPATPKTPKVMSSKLATMKFMQRGAAAAKASPSTPDSATSPDGRSPKRREPMQDSEAATASYTPSSDAAVVRAALAESEAKRQQALDRQMKANGETKWAFSYQAMGTAASEGLRVERVGYADLRPPEVRRDSGRLRFGKFKGKVNVKKRENSESGSSDEDSESEGEANGDEDDAANGAYDFYQDADAMIRSQASVVSKAERKRKRKADEDAKNAEAEKPRKEVKLSRLSSVSGRKNPVNRPGNDAPFDGECFACHKMGHRAADCPVR